MTSKRDEHSYQLSHAYDRLLDATADRHIETRKNWVPASSDEDLMMRSKRQSIGFLKFWLWYMNVLLVIISPSSDNNIRLLKTDKPQLQTSN